MLRALRGWPAGATASGTRLPPRQAAAASRLLLTRPRCRYHTEVVAVTVFHFVKLRHNVTVFTRDDPFEMGQVVNPYFWKGFRRASCRSASRPAAPSTLGSAHAPTGLGVGCQA